MATGERVVNSGDGVLPAVLTFVLPFLSFVIVGEGVLRVLSVFVSRGKNREEWDKMVVETFSNHIVICGVGELGKALVKRLHNDHPADKFVLVDLRPGLLSEIGLAGDNIIYVQSDMTSIETLKKVNCHKARLVLLASGNDAFNLEAAYKILQLNPQSEIWVRLHQSGLADLMDLSRKPNLHFFCPYLQAAEVIANHLLHDETIK
jgi:voltage-gated potassium channel